jgi:hypothetical protein
MKRPFAAILLASLFAGPTVVFAGDLDGYKPGIDSDQSAQTPQAASQKSRLHHASKEKAEAPPLPASGCLEKRSFDAVGDSNSSYDPGIGCSTQANLSAMTENQGDLVRGRGTRYSDGERAGHVVSEYRSWKTSPASSQGASKTTGTQ